MTNKPSMELDEFGKVPMDIHDAVGTVYDKQIDQIISDLACGFSVLVVCDKRIAPYIQGNLQEKMKARRLQPVDLSGGNATKTAQIPKMANIRENYDKSLEKALASGVQTIEGQLTPNARVVLYPHLDMLTTVREGHLSDHARDTILQILYINENEGLVLGFRDPSLPIPTTLERLFDNEIRIDLMNAETFLQVLSRDQAACFHSVRIDESQRMQIFQAVSGLNAAELLQLMIKIANEFPEAPMDEDERAGHLKSVFAAVREFTARGRAKVTIPTSVRVGGFHQVQRQMREELINLIRQRRTTSDGEVIRRIDRLIPRGILLEGPPGTGKTHFARWIASEIQATLYLVNGPELKSKWFGESEQQVRELFARARKTAPSLIVFDEFDSLAGRRGGGPGDSATGANDSIVNQLLTEMDGFQAGELCLVVATTNRRELIDSAFLRPGRFELIYHIGFPENGKERREILEIYVKEFGIDSSLLDKLAAAVEKKPDRDRCSCDHLKGICRVLSRKLLQIQQESGEELVDKVVKNFVIHGKEDKLKGICRVLSRKLLQAQQESGEELVDKVMEILEIHDKENKEVTP